jgi:hypothetical protein
MSPNQTNANRRKLTADGRKLSFLMTTSKQSDANRQNAQRSTGPRSPEGKAASRFNALKSGIDAKTQVIPGENPDQLEALLAEYQERFETTTPERRLLVDTLVASEWLLRRLIRAEGELWQYETDRSESKFSSNAHPEGRVLYHGDRVFERLQRRVDAIHRNYGRALKELQRLEPATPSEPQPSEPRTPPEPPTEPRTSESAPLPFAHAFAPSEPRTSESGLPPQTAAFEPAQAKSNQQLVSGIGFVPQSSEIAPQPGLLEPAAPLPFPLPSN